MILLFFFLLNFTIIFLSIIKDIYKYNINFSEFKQRLGFININDNYKYNYLIHGASCGEILSSKYIINKLKNKNSKFILTSHTPTGYRLIKKYYTKSYLKPYDTIFTNLIFFIFNKPEFIIIIDFIIAFFLCFFFQIRHLYIIEIIIYIKIIFFL